MVVLALMQIRAVLFDLGDTLWHFPNFPSDEALAAEYGRRMEELFRGWGVGGGQGVTLARAAMEADRRLTREAMHGDGRNPDFVGAVRSCAQALGIVVDDERATALWNAMHVGGRFLQRTMFPDSLPLLKELRRRGYAVAAVTNRSFGGERFFDEMRELGLAPLFDAWAVSADDGWLKPHRALFDKALDEIGVSPRDAAMVGDDLHADVLGASSLGMATIWKRPPNRRETPPRRPDGSEVRPDFTIDHPGELLSLAPFKRR